MMRSRFDPQLLARARAAAASPSSAAVSTSPATPAQSGNALDIAAALCRQFEGLHLTPYLCPAGVPTIGYGSTTYPDGRRVRLTDSPISAATAEAMLMHDLRTVRLPEVRRLCPGIDRPGRMAAIIDFAFNVGVGALAASTLRRRINAGEWGDVPAQLRRWVNAGGRRLRGLERRREAEIRAIE